MAYLEGACTVGMTISPIAGSALYTVGGFYLPFLAFGLLLIFGGFIIRFVIPQSCDGGEE
jgi:hypothetical protein